MNWTKFANMSSICVLLIFILFPTSGQAQGPGQIQNYTMDYPCEIVVVLDESDSVKDNDFLKMVELVHEFPTYFKVGNASARVAVVVFSYESRVALGLTADENLVKTLRIDRLYRGSTSTHLAFRDIKEKVFVDARPETLKIVILITDGGSDNRQKAEAAAAELKKDGSLIYVGYVGSMSQDVRDHVNRVAGDPSQVFPVEDFNNLKDKIISQVQQHILCQFEPVCRYDDPKQEKCVEAWWRPRDLVGGLNCTNAPPTSSTQQCQMGDCNATCEKWPWEKWTCEDSNAGQRLTIGREGQMPPNHQPVYENCPTQKEIVCPTVYPITTSTTSPTRRSTRRSTRSSRRSPTASPTESSSMTKETTTAERLTPEHQSTEGNGDEFPSWAIAVVAGVDCLLLLLILLAVMLSVRKRRERRKMSALAKKKADAEMAAMLGRTRNGSMNRFSTPSMRSYGNVPDKMTDRGVGVNLARRNRKWRGHSSGSEMPRSTRTYGFGHGNVPVNMTDRSAGVSLASLDVKRHGRSGGSKMPRSTRTYGFEHGNVPVNMTERGVAVSLASADAKRRGRSSGFKTPGSTQTYGFEYGNTPTKMTDHSVGASLASLDAKRRGHSRASKMPRQAGKMTSPSPARVGMMGSKPSLGGSRGLKARRRSRSPSNWVQSRNRPQRQQVLNQEELRRSRRKTNEQRW